MSATTPTCCCCCLPPPPQGLPQLPCKQPYLAILVPRRRAQGGYGVSKQLQARLQLPYALLVAIHGSGKGTVLRPGKVPRCLHPPLLPLHPLHRPC